MDFDLERKTWNDWDHYNEKQKKKLVRHIEALDVIVKQRKLDVSSNVRKSSKPKEFLNVHKCKTCGFDLDINRSACKACATVCEETFLMDPSIDDIKYKSEFMHYSNIPCMYKRMNHFSEKLSQIQGKERTQICEDLLVTIHNEIKKLNIKIDDVNPKIVKMILKKNNKSKYYEHCNLITHRVNGYQLPQFTPEQEEKLKDMFNLIQEPFENNSPPDRKNFLNYAYIFRKFLELLSYDEFLPFFSELKSRDKLYSQDSLWKQICHELNWEFIPSI
jgi:hypothetical protein